MGRKIEVSTRYKDLDKDILELFVAFWDYRSKMTFGMERVYALSSLVVYLELIDKWRASKVREKIAWMGYRHDLCVEIKKKELNWRERQKHEIAADFGEMYAHDIHEAYFKLDLLYRDCETSFPVRGDFASYHEFVWGDGGGYLKFHDIESEEPSSYLRIKIVGDYFDSIGKMRETRWKLDVV